jgi:hypothetical protein
MSFKRRFEIARSQPATLAASGVDSGAGGYGLAWLAALGFCLGLVGLAVLPAWGVVVPRWFVCAGGAGWALLTLLAMFRSRPWPRTEQGVQAGRPALAIPRGRSMLTP